jgi:hypothetical protein
MEREELMTSFRRAALFHSMFLSHHPSLATCHLSRVERFQLATSLYSLKHIAASSVPRGSIDFIYDRISGLLFHSTTHCFVGNMQDGVEFFVTAVHWARIHGYLQVAAPLSPRGLDAVTGLTLKSNSKQVDKHDILSRLVLILRMLRLDTFISIATSKSFIIDDSEFIQCKPGTKMFSYASKVEDTDDLQGYINFIKFFRRTITFARKSNHSHQYQESEYDHLHFAALQAMNEMCGKSYKGLDPSSWGVPFTDLVPDLISQGSEAIERFLPTLTLYASLCYIHFSNISNTRKKFAVEQGGPEKYTSRDILYGTLFSLCKLIIHQRNLFEPSTIPMDHGDIPSHRISSGIHSLLIYVVASMVVNSFHILADPLPELDLQREQAQYMVQEIIIPILFEIGTVWEASEKLGLKLSRILALVIIPF